MIQNLKSLVAKYWKIPTGILLFWVIWKWMILPGYLLPWTGFGSFTKPNIKYIPEKTLWDWLELFIIPLFLAGGAIFLNHSEREGEQKSLVNQQQEAALQSYLDRMADLLLNEELKRPGNVEAQDIARIRTLTVLRGLDAKRAGIVLHFLHGAELIRNETTIVSLSNIDLSNIDLNNIDLSGANLSGTDLNGADLRGADLRGAELNNVNLKGARLKGAKLENASLNGVILENTDLKGVLLNGVHLMNSNLERANLEDAYLRGANLEKVNLSWANLRGAKLREGANLEGADLRGVKLLEGDGRIKKVKGANLKGANLHKADLSGAKLEYADMQGANLREAKLEGVNLKYANLRNAKVTNEQLATAKSLKGTIMQDGTKHK